MKLRRLISFVFSLLILVSLPLTQIQAAAQKTTTVTLLVKNMTCPVCPITVRKALEKMPGVINVKTDFKTRTATVTFNPNQVKVNDLTHATSEAGYPSEVENKNSSKGK